MGFRLLVPQSVYEAMIAQARAELPAECCGFLAGTIEPGEPPTALVIERYPLVNKLASPVAFESEPRSLVAADKGIRERKLEVVAIYHSHPASDPVPSKTDLAMNYWPGVVNLIISLKTEPAIVRGWWLEEATYREAEWRIVEAI